MTKYIAGALAALALTTLAVMLPPKPVTAQFNSAQGAYIASVSGTVNAITATLPNISSLADIRGVQVTFVPSGPNTGPVTLNINSLGAVNVLRVTGAAMGGGELANVVTVLYNGTSFYVVSPQDLTPPGTAIDIRGATAPTGYLIEDGTCVSQTTYAALFAVISTNYGSCGAGLFALPDSRGTLSAALDNQGSNGAANRITNAGSGCTATAIGFCGAQNQTLTLAQLPTGITSTGSTALSVSTTTTNWVAGNGADSTAINVGQGGANNGYSVSVNGAPTVAKQASTGSTSGTMTSTSSNTSGAAHPILPPVLLARRAVKY